MSISEVKNKKKPLYFQEKSLKYKVVYFVKFTLLLSILMFSTFTFIAPYTRLATMSAVLVISYLMLSLGYFTYAIKEERVIQLNMWKTYFSVIILMMVFIYSTETNLRNFIIDYQKTKLTYELNINNVDANETFAQYKYTIESHLNKNKKEDIIDISKEDKEVKSEKYYTIWYGNLAINVINIMTLFMFLWSLTEFSIFKEREEVDITVQEQ